MAALTCPPPGIGQLQHDGNFGCAALGVATMIAKLNDAEEVRRQPDGLILIATTRRLAERGLGQLLATPGPRRLCRTH
jgi:hypothetical protein